MVEKEINNDELTSVMPLDFNEAIRALKECILIIKGYNSFNEQIYNILKPLNNTEVIDLKPLFKNDDEEKENNNEEDILINKQEIEINENFELEFEIKFPQFIIN